MTAVVMAGLKEGMPDNLLTGATPLSDFKSQKFYKQIFDASGIPETETQQVFDFINSLQSTDQINGHTISDWMKESESFRSRMKVLKKIRETRALFAAGTGFVSSYVMGEVIKEAKEHVIAPAVAEIKDHFASNHSPNPSPDTNNQSPDQPPTPIPTETTLTIDLPNIFKEPSNGVVQLFKFFNEETGKTADVKIPLADGYKFLPPDADGNIDIIKTSDGTVLDNVFILDKSHNALIPNPNFTPDPAHPDVTIDLGKHIDFKTEKQLGVESGEPVNLLDKAENYRIVWGHTLQGNKQPDHDFIFETSGPNHEQHPFGVEIRFKDDGVRNSDTGEITTFDSHFEDGTMAALLEIRGIGQVLLKDCFDKVTNPDGSYYYSLKLDPTSDKPVTLADGTTMTIGELAQIVLNEKALEKYPVGAINSDMKVSTMEIFSLANNDHRGFILIGFETTGDAKGFTPIPGGKIFEALHLVTGTDPIKENATFASPGEPTITETTTMVTPEKPVEVKIPAEILPEAIVSPVTPTPVTNNHSPLPGPFHSPQLHPTTGENPIPVSSTPLPQSIINSAEFKKEKQPKGYDNQDAFNFLNTANRTEEQIDDFIYDKVFNRKQKEFLETNKVTDFIKNSIIPAVNKLPQDIRIKLTEENSDQLTAQDRKVLKTTILQRGVAHGLTNQEATDVYTYLVNKAYLDSLNSAVQEKRRIDEVLEDLKAKLSSLPTPVPIPITRPPTTNPPGTRPTDPPTVSESEIDAFTDQLIQDSSDDGQRKQIPLKIRNFIESCMTHRQIEILENLPEDVMDKVIKISKKEDQGIFSKIYNADALDPQEKARLKEIILELLKDDEQANAFYTVLVLNNNINSIVKKKSGIDPHHDFSPEEMTLLINELVSTFFREHLELNKSQGDEVAKEIAGSIQALTLYFIGQEKRNIVNGLPMGTKEKIDEILEKNHNQTIRDKIHDQIALEDREKDRLKLIILEVLSGEQAEACATFLITQNFVASQVQKKIEAKNGAPTAKPRNNLPSNPIELLKSLGFEPTRIDLIQFLGSPKGRNLLEHVEKQTDLIVLKRLLEVKGKELGCTPDQIDFMYKFCAKLMAKDEEPTAKTENGGGEISGEELFQLLKEAKIKNDWRKKADLLEQIQVLENDLLPELLGTKLNEKILNEKADPDHKLHDLFYPLRNYLIDFLTKANNFNEHMEGQDKLAEMIEEFNQAMKHSYPEFDPKYFTNKLGLHNVKELLRLHDERLAKIKVPAPKIS